MTAIPFKSLAFASLLGLMAFAAHSNEASASSIMGCKADTRNAVIACCSKLVKRKGVPYWMSRGGLTCESAAVCVSQKPGTFAAANNNKVCFISQNGPGGGGSGKKKGPAGAVAGVKG